MSPQTPAQKRAKQKNRNRRTRAYAIIKQMAEAAGYELDEFLDDYENNRTGLVIEIAPTPAQN
jgi:hypothetical protein